jgi:hypothetical protein
MFDGDLPTARLSDIVGALGRLATQVDDAERIDQIRLLEEIKAAAAAAQVLVTTAFSASQRQRARASVPEDRADRSIAHQVALARRISPSRAAREVAWAGVLVEELPNTFAALRAGLTSEWRAMLMARETAWLSGNDRREVDNQLAPHLEGLSDRGVEREARRIAYRLDPAGGLARMESASKGRRVTLSPAPDTMARLTALLPIATGVAAYAALVKAADRGRAAGDSRTRGQLMADTLVERVTGAATAEALPVEIELVMTDTTLVGGSDEPAELAGGHPIPAPAARALVLGEPGNDEKISPRWLRRLFAGPGGGELVAMESRRRCFTPGQRQFVQLRDRTCRTPWCGAPIRQIDHVVAVDDGGATSVANAAGLCESCNYAKQAPGWSARPSPSGSSGFLITTPTGHQYQSRSPDPPGAGTPPAA